MLDDFFDDSLEGSSKNEKAEKEDDNIEMLDAENDSAEKGRKINEKDEDASEMASESEMPLAAKGADETTPEHATTNRQKERKKTHRVAAKRRQALSLEEYVRIRDVILKYLSEQPETLNELAKRYCTEEKQAVIELIPDDVFFFFFLFPLLFFFSFSFLFFFNFIYATLLLLLLEIIPFLKKRKCFLHDKETQMIAMLSSTPFKR